MLTTEPNREFEELKQKLLAEMSSTFPVVDQRSGLSVHVKNLSVDDSHLNTDDIRGQLAARLSGRSYTAPVHADVEVVNKDGTALVSRRMKIADIPKLTRHFTFIHGGQEKAVTNQWRLRPGAYTKKMEKEGEFEVQFQLAKGKSFDIQMDQGADYLFIKADSRKVPLYSVLHASGVSDDAMQKAWGPKIFAATKKKSDIDKDVASFYSASRHGVAIPAGTSSTEALAKYFETTKMDPEVTKTTLGTAHDKLSGGALLQASQKLVAVSGGHVSPDPLDSLEFKQLWTPTDHFVERLRSARNDIHARVTKALSRDTTKDALLAGKGAALRDVMMPDLLQKPINHVFISSLTSTPKQTNPVAMLADRSQTTIMGPGGISSEHMVTRSNTAVDPSHFGYLDPVFTPEGSPGTTTHLAAGVTIRDRQPLTKFYNLQTHKFEELTPAQSSKAVVVMPDQVRWAQGVPKPLHDVVRVLNAKGEVDEVSLDKAHYVMVSPTHVFSAETNLVPFMQNDAAGRTTMSARHMAQAISVVGREAPLVQVQAAPGTTFEERIGGTFTAHRSPVSGTVESVTADEVVVKDTSGAAHSVHLYNHYPTNDKKGMLHSTPLVAPGAKVKTGDVLADHSFTKNGVLALGTNVRVAYIANGSNHEDGLVLSRSAAKRLGSTHLLKPSLYVTSAHDISKERFMRDKISVFEPHQYEKIDANGLIKPGSKVSPGDPLILALKTPSDPDTIDARALARLAKKGGKFELRNAAVTWDSEHPGEVVRVVRSGSTVEVHVKTQEPLQVGSKVSTRHSAKGIVAAVKEDHEMPYYTHNGEKKHVEMLINPVSVPGRMNPGQILETAAAKIAEKTGKPYVVKNFDGKTDYLQKVQSELEHHGLKETEELVDPITGRTLGPVTVGPHYAFQLEHQIDKKTHVRHGWAYNKELGIPKVSYDTNMVPRGGGEAGAQSLGSLGIYGALAAGLKKNLGEMQTLKSDETQAEAVWGALVNGHPLPPPEVPFVYKKFGALLRGAGLRLDKKGAMLHLVPQSDEETLKWAGGKRGEVTKPGLTVAAKNMAPKNGGIFDPTIFGEDKQRWGYISLATPMPNPVFAKAITHILDLPDRKAPHKNLEKILSGELALHGKSGGEAIRAALAAVDVDAKMKELKKVMDDPKVAESDLNSAVYAYKSLRALKEHGKRPDEAYTMQHLPVLPPIYRPYQPGEDRQDRIDPLNQLYRRLGMVNDSLKEQKQIGIPDKKIRKNEVDLFNEMKNLFGTTPKGKKALDIDYRGEEIKKGGRYLPGILHTIAGDSPKDGFFQDRVIGKKQDYTARATIVADPTLGPDEVGLPKKIAFELYRPMVGRSLTVMGMSPLRAQKEISQRTALAESALRKEIEDRPVLLKRDPVLHQYGIVGQRVKLTDSRAVAVSPLILPPINGDIDGDTVAIMLPLTHEAVQEAHKVMPSARPISVSTGELLASPSNEAALALYRMSLRRRETAHAFNTQADAEAAFYANKIRLDDGIKIGGTETTLGRARIAAVVPEQYRQKVFADIATPMSKKFVTDMLKDVAKNTPNHYGEVTGKLTQLGFKMAYESGHTVSLKDIEPLRAIRDKVIAEAAHAVATKPESARTDIWLAATKRLHDLYSEHHNAHPTNVSDMRQSGIKAKQEQFQGLVIAPMLVEDHLGRPSKVPVTRSFAEGVDISGYFLQSAGARKTNIQTVDAVRDPGVLTKELIQANIDSPITSMDCHTAQGINLNVKDRDLVDRYLASPVVAGGHTIPAGTLITPNIQSSLAKSNVSHVFVRSPLKCRMPHGVCSRCMGAHPSGANYQMGENVGIIAAQAIGERASQLMLRQKHAQGIMPLTKGVVDEFATVDQIFGIAKPSAVDATIAPRDGVVAKVEPQAQGGWRIHPTKGQPLFSRQKPLDTVVPGHTFKKGDQLTHGDPNLNTLLRTRGIEATQDWMVNRVGKIYEKENVLRRHVELTIRNSTGTVEVTDPGDHPSILRGDHLQKTVVDEINRTTLQGKRPLVASPVLKSTETLTARRQQDWMGRLQSNQLHQHIMTAAALGEKSDLHGLHPVSGLAYGAEFAQRGHQSAAGY